MLCINKIFKEKIGILVFNLLLKKKIKKVRTRVQKAIGVEDRGKVSSKKKDYHF
jgi:hypothetical protein